MDPNKRDDFLASSIVLALEKNKLSSVQGIFDLFECDSSKIDSSSGIAPLHYACGMDDIEIGEKAVEIMMKYCGNINVATEDGITPLHVAAIANRSKTVQLLLENGASMEAVDNERKSAIQYAIADGNIEVIKVFQSFVFEKKLIEKRNKSLTNSNKLNTPPKSNSHGYKLKPNEVFYNFDRSSPYYINITHRKTSTKTVPAPLWAMNFAGDNIASSTLSGYEPRENLNLFELTEENLEKFSQQSDLDINQSSLIERWRERVQRTRARSSIVQIFSDVDELISGLSNNESLNYKNTAIDPCYMKQAENTVKPETSETEFVKLLQRLGKRKTDSENSFLTAVDRFEDSNFIRSPNGGEYIIQVAESYTHSDAKNGVVFIETHVHSNPADRNEILKQRKSSMSSKLSVPSSYDTDLLREELTVYGEAPGPITKTTKKLYMKRLIRYKRNTDEQPDKQTDGRKAIEPQFSVELERTTLKKEWFDRIEEYLHLEKEMIEYFEKNSCQRKFREGNAKTSFIYLLIDPRISKNLPGEYRFLTPQAAWSRFVQSVFYTGKGKSSRPYSHLYDALKTFTGNYRQLCRNDANERKENVILKIANQLDEKRKLENILSIWAAGGGVVCLHVFHNTMPAEAYTREAAIIDALGLKHLTNLKRGDYYGPCQSWTMRNKKFLGILLLYKAFRMYIAEGETQLRPHDL